MGPILYEDANYQGYDNYFVPNGATDYETVESINQSDASVP